jgi:hypothetical protein
VHSFVGTESRLPTRFDLLKQISSSNDTNPATRLAQLHQQRNAIIEPIRLFLPDSSNEVRLIDEIDTHINKIVELESLRKLKAAPPAFGVRRILKGFVDAQWLVEFDIRLAAYRSTLNRAPTHE